MAPPVARTPLGQAKHHFECAITAVILAGALDGIRRDQSLRDAIDNVRIGLALVEGEMTPPPVPPAVAQRADMFAIACSISGALTQAEADARAA